MDKIPLTLSGWISQSGDMTFWSWIITIMYAVTIIVSIYYVNKLRPEENSGKRFLWICIMFFLAAMGINKQLDFQTLLIIVGRSMARHQGWLEQRRIIQACFTIGAVSCILTIAYLILFRIRKIIRHSIIELSGVAILVFFMVIRAGSMNHIKFAISFEENKTPHIHGIELLGIIVILFALFNHLKKLPRKNP